MIRLTMFLVIALTAGAIVNVLVAWACVMWSPETSEYAIDRREWPVRFPDHWIRQSSINSTKVNGIGINSRIAMTVASPEIAGNEFISGSVGVLVAGLPCGSVYTQRAREEAMQAWFGTLRFNKPATLKEGIAIPPWLSERDALTCLPTVPVWPGFAINTVFYAMICWGLFATPGMIRRRWRVRRSRCAACDYPMGSSEVCTECGEAVRAKPS